MSRRDLEAAVAQLPPDELQSFFEWVDDYRSRRVEHTSDAPTAYALGRDIFGSMAGAEDVSTNPRYMEGFGERSLV